jgi:enoyl-CoA hydratase/carnithine racemase
MSDVTYTQEGPLAWIRLNRPESRNGLLPETCTLLVEALERASQDADVRVIVLGSGPKAFCSGADLTGAISMVMGGEGLPNYDKIIRNHFHALIRAVTNAPKPVIASIRGSAVGFGFDLALACDLRISSQSGKFGALFVQRALVPDGGSSFTLSRLIGLHRAMELILLGDTFDAAKAQELGLLNRLTDEEQLETVTRELAQRLADGPPMALRLARANILASLSGSFDEALERELHAQVQCLQSQDVMEGVQAFFEKRKPAFKGC